MVPYRTVECMYRRPHQHYVRLLELYHAGSSHFFGIGIYPVSDTAGIGIFGRYCCTVSFGGNTFLRFCGNSFFEKFRGNSFFSSKGGRNVQKGGQAPAIFLRGSRQIFDTKNTDRVFRMVNTSRKTDRCRPQVWRLDLASSHLETMTS